MEEAPTRAGVFPGRDEIMARYASRSGMSDIAAGEFDYFCALAYWRIAIIAEGIKRRYQSGAMSAAGDIDAIERRIHARAKRAAFHMARAERSRS
jgi:aminoglycoside phosphotransferase (APT) family kinase protein